MMLKNIIKPGSILLMLAVVLLAGTSTFAQSNNIKAQMRARLPIIDALKGENVIGETNDGYVAFVGAKKMKADVIAAENQDRRKVYEAIAKQQGTTPEVVGKLRAKQIAERAVPGTWLQDEKGKWYQKK